jgi:hypothetical protein
VGLGRAFHVRSLAQIRPVNLLLSNYWTMGAVRNGDYVAKIRIAPVPELASRVARAAVRALDGGRHAAGDAVPGQASDQRGNPVRGMLDRELGGDLAPASTTHTACVSAAQSIPVKNSASGSARDTVTPQDGSDGTAAARLLPSGH